MNLFGILFAILSILTAWARPQLPSNTLLEHPWEWEDCLRTSEVRSFMNLKI